MKILHVTNYDNLGGAGIAAYRLHTALRKAGVDSRMLVRRKGTNDPTVAEVGSFVPVDGCSLIVDEERPQQPIIRQLNNCWARLPVRARGWLGAKLTKVLGMEGCSLNIFPTGLHKVLNASDADVIHLHWINNEMISIKEIAKIKKPIVWTLHDMWAMTGAEHYSSAEYWRDPEDRGQKTEIRNQKPDDGRQMSEGQTLTPSTQHPATKAKLFNAVNRIIFNRKMLAWRNLKVHFVAPSNWMAEQVRKSALFAEAPVIVIPNCLDMDVFKPLNKAECRQHLNLPMDKKLVLFGAFDPVDLRKGGDLFEQALNNLCCDGVEIIIFGADGARDIAGLKTYWMGAISSEKEMAELYNVADVICVSSRWESFGQTASESLACGVPVVAFRTSGLVDIVDHQKNGWLTEPYDTRDLSNGILWVLNQKLTAEYEMLSKKARVKTESVFSQAEVVRQYNFAYTNTLYPTNVNKQLVLSSHVK